MTRKLLIILISAVLSVATNAQTVATDSVETDTPQTTEKKPWLGKRVVNKLGDMYFKSKYDTLYVARPHQKWLIRILGNQTGNYLHAKSTLHDVNSKFDLHTRTNYTMGVEVNYCDIAATLAVNPAKIGGKNNDFELNFEYHGQKISLDISYLRAKSLQGDIVFPTANHLDEDVVTMKVVNFTAYYTFNNHRFSFPAALYQNYYQLRSAGSWLAGLSLQTGSLKTTDKLKERDPLSPVSNVYFTNIALGGGYGYNLVLGHRSEWLLHISLLPSFVVYKHNSLTINDEKMADNSLCFNMLFNERASVVYHFSPRFNIGASLIMSNSLYNNDNVKVNQNKWLARFFFGMRF